MMIIRDGDIMILLIVEFNILIICWLILFNILCRKNKVTTWLIFLAILYISITLLWFTIGINIIQKMGIFLC